MINGLCESPLTFQAITIWRNELLNEEIMLRDVIDLETTFTEIGDSNELDAEIKKLDINDSADTLKSTKNEQENQSISASNETKNDEDEEEEDAINVSLAAMELSLTPHILNILEDIDKKYTKLKELEKKRMKATFDKNKKFSNKEETKYQDFKKSIAMFLNSDMSMLISLHIFTICAFNSLISVL